jgi:hypothetical protein
LHLRFVVLQQFHRFIPSDWTPSTLCGAPNTADKKGNVKNSKHADLYVVKLAGNGGFTNSAPCHNCVQVSIIPLKFWKISKFLTHLISGCAGTESRECITPFPVLLRVFQLIRTITEYAEGKIAYKMEKVEDLLRRGYSIDELSAEEKEPGMGSVVSSSSLPSKLYMTRGERAMLRKRAAQRPSKSSRWLSIIRYQPTLRIPPLIPNLTFIIILYCDYYSDTLMHSNTIHSSYDYCDSNYSLLKTSESEVESIT